MKRLFAPLMRVTMAAAAVFFAAPLVGEAHAGGYTHRYYSHGYYPSTSQTVIIHSPQRHYHRPPHVKRHHYNRHHDRHYVKRYYAPPRTAYYRPAYYPGNSIVIHARF